MKQKPSAETGKSGFASMRVTLLFILLILHSSFIPPEDFLTAQKKYERVRTAFREKEKLIDERLREKNIPSDELNILVAAFKEEKQLIVYAKKKTGGAYTELATYSICAGSGDPGPKRRAGDGQVPEGFYTINRFNPVSAFYLSMGISYPNQSDRIKSNFKNTGGDIFIHGSCVTIGCMPVTDDKIKEIYLYAILAKHNGQADIPVYIFPFKMTEKNFARYATAYEKDKELLSFWENLRTGYSLFEKDRTELHYTIDKKGNYCY